MLNDRNCQFALILLANLLWPGALSAADSSLRFFGYGQNQVDRVRIRLDDPSQSNDPTPRVDIGATDFTIEFWMKTWPSAVSSSAGCDPDDGHAWIHGNIIIDRDRFNRLPSFGISLVAQGLIFGIASGEPDARSLCGSITVADGEWHHVAVTFDQSTGSGSFNGVMSLYVDGVLDASSPHDHVDISFPDDAVPGPSGAFDHFFGFWC